MDNNKLLEIINRMEVLFRNVDGRQMSYDERGSDFFNPIYAGMQLQQLKFKFHELVKLLPFEIDKKKTQYQPIYKLKEEL